MLKVNKKKKKYLEISMHIKKSKVNWTLLTHYFIENITMPVDTNATNTF